MVKAAFFRALLGNTDTLTAQAFIYPKSDDTDDTLAVLLCGEGDNAFNQIRQLGLQLKESFFSQDLTVAQNFSLHVQKFHEELKNLQRFDAMLIFYQKGVVYFQNIKYSRTYLKRAEDLNELTSDENPGKFMSGMVKAGDRMLFLTPSFLSDWQEPQEALWSDPFVARLLKTENDQIQEELSLYMKNKNRFDPIALITVNFFEQEKKEEQIAEQKEEEKVVSPVISQIPPAYTTKAPTKSLILDFFRAIPALIHSLFFQSKKMAIIFIIVVLVLGGVLFNFFRGMQNKNTQGKEYDQLLSSSQQLIQQAKQQDISKARDLFSQAQNDLNKAKTIKPNDEQIRKLQQNLDTQKNDILKIYSVSNFSTFLSLDLIKSGFLTDRFSLVKNDLLLLDTKQRSLVMVDIGQKNNQILAGGDKIGDALFSDLSESYAFVFSQDKGIVRANVQNNKVENSVKVDKEWGKITDIATFAGNVYLLDGLNNQIWKYIATTTGYSDRTGYLAQADASLANAQRMRIDASIWVLNADGGLLKFTQGNKDSITLDQLDPELKKITAFFVSDETDNVYVLDTENGRVVVFGKDGKYKETYQGDTFKKGTDIVVDEKGKKLYLLAEGKIYQVELH